MRLLRVGMSVEAWIDTGFADVVAAQDGRARPVTAMRRVAYPRTVARP